MFKGLKIVIIPQMQNPQPLSTITKNIHLLIACSQADPTSDDIEEIRSFFKNKELSEDEWENLMSHAHRHSVFPFLYLSLKKYASDAISQSKLQELKSFYLNITGHNMHKTAELIQIEKIAAENGFTILPFKGPVLAQIAYGNVSLRQFSDLDILVHRKHFRVLAKHMLKRGYKPLYPIDTFKGDKVMFDMNNDCPFYSTKRRQAVEIHWDFFRKLALPTERFKPWEDTRPVSIDNRTLTTLSNETHLLYHSLHGSKHVWERLGWIVDIDRFIRAIPGLDWSGLMKVASDVGAQRMFLLGVALARKYFKTPVPEDIRLLCENSKFTPFITYVEAELNSDNPTPEDSLIKLTKIISLRDTLYHKVLTLLDFMFRPGINERRTIILPDCLFWLYWLIRPFGMGLRFFFCRLLRLCGPKSEKK